MKSKMMMLIVCLASLGVTNAAAGTGRQDTVDRLQKSVEVLHAIMATPDKGIPEEVLSNAKCIMVVPDLIKGGFIIGGKHGRGVATCRTSNGWSAPAFADRGQIRQETGALAVSCWNKSEPKKHSPGTARDSWPPDSSPLENWREDSCLRRSDEFQINFESDPQLARCHSPETNEFPLSQPPQQICIRRHCED